MRLNQEKKSIAVAIALIVRHGKVAVAWRDAALVQGNCYEFAGGKIESGETEADATIREVAEELGLVVVVTRQWANVQYEYTDRTVQLSVMRCRISNADLIGNGRVRWLSYDELKNMPFPSANQQFLPRLDWDRLIAIVPFHCGIMAHNLGHRDVHLCYLRHWSLSQIIQLLAQRPSQHLIINVEHYQQLNPEQQSQIFAIHLTAQQLHQEAIFTQVFRLQRNIIAACHTAHDIERANSLGVDAIFLSPVLTTNTHPDANPLGWAQFAQLAGLAEMTVFALGGVQRKDLPMAQYYGAYGVAGIRDFGEQFFGI